VSSWNLLGVYLESTWESTWNLLGVYLGVYVESTWSLLGVYLGVYLEFSYQLEYHNYPTNMENFANISVTLVFEYNSSFNGKIKICSIRWKIKSLYMNILAPNE